VPREAVAGLREAVHAYHDIAARFAELPYTDGHGLTYLALAPERSARRTCGRSRRRCASTSTRSMAAPP